MSKASGGTRNYSGNPKTMAKRESEFQAIVSTGNYKDSYFDKSGGYYVVHKYHNEIALVRQATYFTSKKGTKCLRLLVYQNGENKTVISCFNLPNEIITGMFVEYQISSESFVNNVRRIRL